VGFCIDLLLEINYIFEVMKPICAFLFVVISQCVVGQTAEPFLKVFPIKITCLEIPLDSIVKIQAIESKTLDSKKVESHSHCCCRVDYTSYYVDGIKIRMKRCRSG
jgi:hypothetical protein